jgi:hypothetical protein
MEAFVMLKSFLKKKMILLFSIILLVGFFIGYYFAVMTTEDTAGTSLTTSDKQFDIRINSNRK